MAVRAGRIRGRCAGAIGALLAAALLMLGAGAALAAERVALLIGNGEYQHTSRLKNPGRDVAAMARALEALGYAVETATDLDRRAMGRALRRFSRNAAAAETAVLFYSGHGMEIAGRNYLIPTDAELEREEDAGFEAIALDDAAAAAAGAARLSVVILDACRDNRFAGATRSGTRGFRPVRARSGQLIAYAAAAGAVAFDGEGALSPYTQALTEALGDPARAAGDVRVLFGGLSRRVSELAGGAQNPAVYQSGFGPERVTLAAAPADLARPEPAAASQEALAKAAYDDAAAIGYAPAMRDVAEFYPNTYWGRKAARDAEGLPEGRRTGSRWGEAGAETSEPEPAPRSFTQRLLALPQGESRKECDACPEMVAIPGGNFTMGSPSDEAGRDGNEGPTRSVTIQPFALGRDAVTVAEFRRFVRATRREMSGGCWSYVTGEWKKGDALSWRDPGFSQGDDHPAVCVSWEDAKAYVAWLNDEVEGSPYRLPSEAEQEYVLRADHGAAAYPWGGAKNAGCAAANGADQSAKRRFSRWTVSSCDDGYVFSAPVGAFPANRWGVRLLSGNVWEWAEDCWNDSYSGAPSDGLDWKSGDCSLAVLRGGSWSSNPWWLRSALRYRDQRGNRGSDSGFRVARTHVN